MELHSKDFSSKKDYHNKRRELVSNGHIVAHSNGVMTKFHPKPHVVSEFMSLDDEESDLALKWVVLPSRSGIEVFQATKYQQEYTVCEQQFGKVEVSPDKKTITVHLYQPCK